MSIEKAERMERLANNILRLAKMEKEDGSMEKTSQLALTPAQKEQLKEDEPKETLEQAQAEAKSKYKEQHQDQLYQMLKKVKASVKEDNMKLANEELEKIGAELGKDENFEVKKQAFVLGYLKGMEKMAGEVSQYYEKQMDLGYNWRERFKFDKVAPEQLEYLESIVDVPGAPSKAKKIDTLNPKDTDTKDEKFYTGKHSSDKEEVKERVASLDQEEEILDEVLDM